MKKKLALMCMAGVVIAGLSACGGKNADEAQETAVNSVQTLETDETDTGEESTGSEASTEEEKVSDREDYVGIQDLDIENYVTLMDYKNMKVSVAKAEVTDERITEYINREFLTGSITDRAVEEGDIVDIDFEGKKDGVAFQGGTAVDYKLVIGSGSFIPGFEDGLVGVMPGETVDLNLSFPEDYKQNKELAGQEVVFTVTVNGIEGSAEYETVTLEEMQRLGLSYESKEEVWETGKKDLEENAEEVFAAEAKNEVIQKLVEESEVESIPAYLIEEEAQNYKHYMESFTQAMYGMDADTYIRAIYGITPEEFNDQMNDSYTQNVRMYLVMEAVARAEGIEVTKEDIEKKARAEAAELGYPSGEELIEDVGFTTFRMVIVQDKVMERLMEIVTVEEEAAQETADS